MLAPEEEENGVSISFFEWLQDKCRERRMTVGKLADGLAIPRTTLYYHAHKPREVKIGLAEKLGYALRIPTLDILDAAIRCKAKSK